MDALSVSTRQLTNASQVVTDAVSYDAWGNVLSSSGTTVNPYKFVGQLGYYADSDSELMLLGARYYGAGVGRFWTVDPIRDALNWCSYVRNNPANVIDPTGKLAWWVSACLAGAIIAIIGLNFCVSLIAASTGAADPVGRDILFRVKAVNGFR
ncbi:MAG: RHS repeat-associated core domain-containing protein [Abditibacteriales bacterium]|nr:RHS repeat-associated core domain-containing protein [Abditibacteriales bacterium]